MMSFIQQRRALKSALTATTIAAAMAATAGTAFAAGNPADAAAKAAERPGTAAAKGKLAAPRAAAGEWEQTATFPMAAIEREGWLDWYVPNGHGGFEAAQLTASNMKDFKHVLQVDQDKDGNKDGAWSILKDGTLFYADTNKGSAKTIGGGW